MSKEYWKEVLKLEVSPECQEHYKNLENLYRDCWKNRSILQEIDLSPKTLSPQKPKILRKPQKPLRQLSTISTKPTSIFPHLRKSSNPSIYSNLPIASFKIPSKLAGHHSPKFQ